MVVLLFRTFCPGCGPQITKFEELFKAFVLLKTGQVTGDDYERSPKGASAETSIRLRSTLIL